jgi:hypothetical protein
MNLQVTLSAQEQFSGITESAQSLVALIAQQFTNLATRMTVVNLKAPLFAVRQAERLSANVTLAVLRGQHRVPLRNRQLPFVAQSILSCFGWMTSYPIAMVLLSQVRIRQTPRFIFSDAFRLRPFVKRMILFRDFVAMSFTEPFRVCFRCLWVFGLPFRRLFRSFLALFFGVGVCSAPLAHVFSAFFIHTQKYTVTENEEASTNCKSLEGSYIADPNLGEVAATVWEQKFGKKPTDNIFNSRALFFLLESEGSTL